MTPFLAASRGETDLNTGKTYMQLRAFDTEAERDAFTADERNNAMPYTEAEIAKFKRDGYVFNELAVLGYEIN